MSESSTHALSTRLFIQAAITGLLAPTARSSTWMVLTFAIAGGVVGVALLLRNGSANAKQLVVGFEGLAVAVGGLGLASGHYIPGTIVGVATLITALNAPAGAPAAAASPWVPPADAAAQPVAPFGTSTTTASSMDNPYAAPPQATMPAWAPPAPAAPPVQERPEDMAPAPRAMNILPGR